MHINESMIADGTYPYTTITPWLYNFDFLLTFCGLNWMNPGILGDKSPCIFRVDRSTDLMNNTFSNDEFERIHVLADRDQMSMLFNQVLPHYKRRFEETGKRIILHTGGGDRSTHYEPQGRQIIEVGR